MVLKKLDYFFVLRPTLFFPVWTVSLAGYWAQERFGTLCKNSSQVVAVGSDVNLLFVLLILTLMMAGIFLLNQLYDVETDRINNKLYLIASGAISKKAAYWEMGILMLTPLFLLIPARYDLVVIMLLIYFVTGYLYNCYPFQLKNRPFGGIFANLVGGFLIFAVGWCVKGRLSINLVFHALPYLIGFLAVYFYTTIPDIDGDLKVSKNTVAVKYGVKPVLLLGNMSILVAIIMAIFAQDIIVLLPTALVLPFFLISLKSKNINRVLETNKYATLFLSLMICYRFPLYLVIIIIIYFFSKWYYKKRFHVDYPSLKPSQ